MEYKADADSVVNGLAVGSLVHLKNQLHRCRNLRRCTSCRDLEWIRLESAYDS